MFKLGNPLTTPTWTSAEAQETLDSKKTRPQRQTKVGPMRSALLYGLQTLVMAALCGVMLIAVGLEALHSKLEDME